MCTTLCALLVAAWVRPGLAAFECNDDGWEGMSEFLALARATAGENRVKLVAELDFGSLSAEDSLIVVHPEVTLDDKSLSAFVQQGGRAAVLDDFGKSTAFAERFGIRRVDAPVDPVEVLRGNRHLSVGTPVETTSAEGSPLRHPLVKDVDRVVLNHPSTLTNPGLTAVLELRTRSGGSYPVVVTGVVGGEQAGRLLIMSDPSAFINLMIRYPGNLNFARALIRYLSEDDGRAGKGRLFIVANRFEQTGTFSIHSGPMAELIHDAEDLLKRLRAGLPPPMLVFLAAALALGVARWIAKHTWLKLPPAIPRSLRPVPLAAQAGWPGRAGVLFAPTTHAALLVLELREAFRARVLLLIGADPTTSNHALVALVESKRLLTGDLINALRAWLGEVDAVEQAVASRRPVRISKSTLLRLLRQSLDILDHLSERELSQREPRPATQ